METHWRSGCTRSAKWYPLPEPVCRWTTAAVQSNTSRTRQCYCRRRSATLQLYNGRPSQRSSCSRRCAASRLQPTVARTRPVAAERTASTSSSTSTCRLAYWTESVGDRTANSTRRSTYGSAVGSAYGYWSSGRRSTTVSHPTPCASPIATTTRPSTTTTRIRHAASRSSACTTTRLPAIRFASTKSDTDRTGAYATCADGA